MARYAAMLEERGNGLAGAGEYVTDAGDVYRVVGIYGPIHTGPAGSPNYVHAVVESADWDDVDDDTEPYCTAVVGAEMSDDAVKAVL